MRSIKSLIAGLAVALLVSTGAFAGTSLNEVGAMLVFPTIIAVDETDDAERIRPMTEGVETFITITNAGGDPVWAHVSYINGEAGWMDDNGDWYHDSDYCYECDFELHLSGFDTETLVISSFEGQTKIESEDSGLELNCPWDYGMIVVTHEDEAGMTDTRNVLLGEEVIIDYARGTAASVSAVSIQGSMAENDPDPNDGDRSYRLDGSEFDKLPRIVAADFLAPSAYEDAYAYLSLFTLGFERQFPPAVDCSVIGFDANENPFSSSFQFGCWTFMDLYEISPEFYYPNLGLYSDPFGDDADQLDTHGWLQLNCRVDEEDDGEFDANGGVHGAIFQYQGEESKLPAGGDWKCGLFGCGQNVEFESAAAWGRLLYQSVGTGDAVTLTLEEPYTGGLLD